MTPRLELRNLQRSFNGREVVRDLSLMVQPGQLTCLLGPSGCGKSTILRIIAGVDHQNGGTILVDGEVISDDRTHTLPENRHIGLMFQDFALFPHMSVAENVAFGLKGSARANREKVGDLLERVHMIQHMDAYPHELSGGEQQRVALARALAPEPAILLMDEPFSGLDNRLRDGIRDETLQVLKEAGTAVLLVTHEPEEALRMADEIALMRDGRIVQRGTPYQIYNHPADKRAAAFFSDINVISGTSHGALTETAFGSFLTPGHQDGAPVEIVIRPRHIGIDFDRNGKGPSPTERMGTAARATVKRSRFMGGESLVVFDLDQDGSALTAVVPGVFLPRPGTTLWLTLRRDRCFVFPAEST